MYRIVADYLLNPYFVLLVLAAGGVLRLWWRPMERRWRLWWVTAPVLLLWVLSMPAVAFLALGSLEWAYPERPQRPAGAEAIVVLGGYVSPPSETRPRAMLGWNSLNRCFRAADLYEQGPRCPVLITGGDMEPDKPGPTLAEAMGDFLHRYGIPQEDLWLETESLSTFENARECSEILASRGIRRVILVTDAIHLRRAEMCFRKQGVEVLPVGCLYGASKFEWSGSMFLPNPGAIIDVQRVLHEWLGIAYYRLRGRI
jgi:uncharacterized SAM-binding protein YcdF (DUF218 family)